MVVKDVEHFLTHLSRNMPSLDYTHPREYGPGSRSWYFFINVETN